MGYGAPELPDHMNGRIFDPLLGRLHSALGFISPVDFERLSN
jgi:hypothetical protein